MTRATLSRGEIEMTSWHACLTRARTEKKAAERLTLKGLTTYLPTIPRERQWKDRTKTVQWPVFPSYVFCRFTPEQLLDVVRTPGVATVVRHRGEPAPIRDEEMENIRRFIERLTETGREADPAPTFRSGERVRVVHGPFRGVSGSVCEVRGRRRLLVGIEGIGQALEVDLGADAVEAVSLPPKTMRQ